MHASQEPHAKNFSHPLVPNIIYDVSSKLYQIISHFLAKEMKIFLVFLKIFQGKK